MYFIASILILIFLKRNTNGRKLFFLIYLQQLFVITDTYGPVVSIISGHYLDGTIVSRVHLITDQAIYIVKLLLHSIAVYSISKK